MANAAKVAGREARQKLGWFYSHRFLLLRRLTQLGVLLLFVSGPLFGRWILKGNYGSSRFLLDALKSDTSSIMVSVPAMSGMPEVVNSELTTMQLNPVAKPLLIVGQTPQESASIPMTDPLLMLQSLLTGHWPELTVLLGAVIAVLLYGLLAGKLFCGWVCPFNLVTDLAAWLRRKLGISSQFNLPPSIRYFVLVAVLVVSAVSGVLVWEWLNPVSTLGRGVINTAWEYSHQVSLGQALVLGFGAGAWLLVAIFLLDLFVFKHGWCGHLCPMGALYGVIGAKGLMHIEASRREVCTKCMDCINVCPEPQVLPRPLFAKQESNLISSQACLRCGRCIDVCPEKVFSIQFKLKR